jgi:hypothetical protein
LYPICSSRETGIAVTCPGPALWLEEPADNPTFAGISAERCSIGLTLNLLTVSAALSDNVGFKIYLMPEGTCQMRSATILALMLFMAASRVSAASALLFLTPLAGMDRLQLPSPGDSRGKLSADQEAGAPRPNPDASGKYHVGDGVSAPKLVFAPDPEFTAKASRKKLGGMLVVSLTLDAAGKPQDHSAASSTLIFKHSGYPHAVEAVIKDAWDSLFPSAIMAIADLSLQKSY